MKQQNGFTIVEMMIVLVIVAVLTALSLAGLNRAKTSARMAKEVVAGKNLMTAYLAHSYENNGKLMLGMEPRAIAYKSDGTSYSDMIAERWPARLAPYLDWNFNNSICVNETEKWSNIHHGDNLYKASVFPAFGMNNTFVGGMVTGRRPWVDHDEKTYGDFCIRRLSDADSAGEQLVFISARNHPGGNVNVPEGKKGEGIHGNVQVYSPNLTSRRWTRTFSTRDHSELWGNVHPRYHEKAIATFLDGSVRPLSTTQQQDMRYWAKGARLANDPTWTLR